LSPTDHFSVREAALIEASRLQREAIERVSILDAAYAPCYYIPGYDAQPTENPDEHQ